HVDETGASVTELFFFARDPSTTSAVYQLWKTDGTTVGTVQLTNSPSTLWPIDNTADVNGTFFFTTGSRDALWKSDGTPAGTMLVKDFSAPFLTAQVSEFTAIDDILYFRVNTVEHGYELWRSDGTEAGTFMVRDIWPGADSSGPLGLTNINGALYFNANDGVHGEELWRSDGSFEGTVMLADLTNGSSAGSNPTQITAVGATIFVVATSDEFGTELYGWTSNTPPIADAGRPYTVVEGSTVVLDAGNSTDVDLPNDTLNYEWDLDGDGVYGETGADALYGDEGGVTPDFDASSLDGPLSVTVSLRVTDSFGEADVTTTTIGVVNLAPIISLDTSPLTLVEGSVTSRLISAYDVGPDAVFVTASVGVILDNGNGTWTWTFAAEDDLPTTTVAIVANDDDGDSTQAEFSLTVLNADPVITSSSVSVSDGSSLVSIQIGFADAGLLDQHTVTVDWGDGTSSAYSPATNPQAAQHDYESGGVYTIQTVVTDDDGGEASSQATTSITGTRINEGVLQIVGTDEDDHVLISSLLGRINVTASFVPGWLHTQSFDVSTVERIEIYLGAGDDMAVVTPNVIQSVLANGGTGNDMLLGGRGDDVLLGGDGDDFLNGGPGNDLLIGGLGRDRIIGNRGGDIVIGGYTVHDGNNEALLAMSAEWSSTRSYLSRVENLQGTNLNVAEFGDRLNQEFYLVPDGPSQTVFDDSERDQLIGNGGRDWYFAKIDDTDLDLSDSLAGLEDDELLELIQ
ncbi:MAG: hypothetical protein KDA92_02395, partial [Planctomycetales bacterium]|nr:hypothetical protein [Planctomycetales bacterium]